jgi:E3 ubiquitin-protein ligase HUWE1
MEDAHYAPQDDMADNDIDENDDIEMEYADETGSEATSHSEGDDADLDTPALGDDWVDEEGDASNLIENEEEGDDDLESMDEGDDEQDEDDEEGDEEDARDDAGMWPVRPVFAKTIAWFTHVC